MFIPYTLTGTPMQSYVLFILSYGFNEACKYYENNIFSSSIKFCRFQPDFRLQTNKKFDKETESAHFVSLVIVI